MIRNEKQYHNTKKHLKEFTEVLLDNQKNYNEGDDLALLELKGVESRIRKFEEELSEYESLKNGTLTTVTLNSLGELPELLIKARIAKNWTQAELAEKAGLKEQQVQKYESTDYAGASTWKLQFIMDTLGIKTPPIQVKVSTPKFDIGGQEELVGRAQQALMGTKTLWLKIA